MTPHRPPARPIVALVLCLAAAGAQAVDNLSSSTDLESRHRSKIVKMKAKQAAVTAENFSFLSPGEGGEAADCGSQSIGNFTGNRRSGPQPREIFVFAPGAINVVSGSACR